jgi:opacity protein-like surface antigen
MVYFKIFLLKEGKMHNTKLVLSGVIGFVALLSSGSALAQYNPYQNPTYPVVVTNNNVPYSDVLGNNPNNRYMPQGNVQNPQYVQNANPQGYGQYSAEQNTYVNDSKKSSSSGKKYFIFGASYALSDSRLVGACDDYYFGNCYDNGDMGTATVLTLGVGFQISSKLRFDITYNRATGLSYGDSATYYMYDTYGDEYYDDAIPVRGGEISSDYVMLTGYFDLTDTFTSFKKSPYKPYIGFGIGYAFNTIENVEIDSQEAEYAMDWSNGYYDIATASCTTDEDGACVMDADHIMTYVGATTKSVAWQVVLGATYRMSRNMFLDFSAKYVNLGKVQTSASGFDNYWEYKYTDTDADNLLDTIGAPAATSDGSDPEYVDYLDVTPESGTILLKEVAVSVNVLF